jgi:hypothetical protein
VVHPVTGARLGHCGSVSKRFLAVCAARQLPLDGVAAVTRQDVPDLSLNYSPS